MDKKSESMKRVFSMDLLRQGGAWLGEARTWLHENKLNGDSVRWGSDEELRPPMTVRDCERLAARAAASMMNEMNARWNHEQQGKQDEQRFTMGEIAEWLPTVTHASALLKDKHYGIAAFTARNKESKS